MNDLMCLKNLKLVSNPGKLFTIRQIAGNEPFGLVSSLGIVSTNTFRNGEYIPILEIGDYDFYEIEVCARNIDHINKTIDYQMKCKYYAMLDFRNSAPKNIETTEEFLNWLTQKD